MEEIIWLFMRIVWVNYLQVNIASLSNYKLYQFLHQQAGPYVRNILYEHYANAPGITETPKATGKCVYVPAKVSCQCGTQFDAHWHHTGANWSGFHIKMLSRDDEQQLQSRSFSERVIVGQ